MLYQPQPKFKLSRLFARFAIVMRKAPRAKARHDLHYLEGASAHLLGDIGLRRVESGIYRSFRAD